MGLQIEHCKNAEQAIGSFAARTSIWWWPTIALQSQMPDYSLIWAVRDYPGKRFEDAGFGDCKTMDDAAHKAEILRLGATILCANQCWKKNWRLRAFQYDQKCRSYRAV